MKENFKEFQRLLKKAVPSQTCLDLLIFFTQNRYVVDTAMSLARRLGKDVKDVKEALSYLEKEGFLERLDSAGEETIFSFMPNEEMEKKVNALVKFISTPEGREEVKKRLRRS